jgi:hypothetical protein
VPASPTTEPYPQYSELAKRKSRQPLKIDGLRRAPLLASWAELVEVAQQYSAAIPCGMSQEERPIGNGPVPSTSLSASAPLRGALFYPTTNSLLPELTRWPKIIVAIGHEIGYVHPYSISTDSESYERVARCHVYPVLAHAVR